MKCWFSPIVENRTFRARLTDSITESIIPFDLDQIFRSPLKQLSERSGHNGFFGYIALQITNPVRIHNPNFVTQRLGTISSQQTRKHLVRARSPAYEILFGFVRRRISLLIPEVGLVRSVLRIEISLKSPRAERLQPQAIHRQDWCNPLIRHCVRHTPRSGGSHPQACYSGQPTLDHCCPSVDGPVSDRGNLAEPRRRYRRRLPLCVSRGPAS